MPGVMSGPVGPPMDATWSSNPREQERGKFGPCSLTGRRPASCQNRGRTSPPTGRPNEAVPGEHSGLGPHEVGKLEIVFALATEAHVNCQRRKKNKDADTYAHQDSVRFLARDPRSERGL